MKNNFLVTPDLYATKGSRFVNYIVDLVVIILIFYTVFLGSIFLYYSFAEDTTTVDAFLDDLDNVNSLVDRLITAIVFALLYFTIESLTKGRSLGKYITKTKVVLEDGSRPSSLDYLKRSFSRVIPLEPFSFLGAEGRGWHDTISKTYVVDINKFEEKIKFQDELDEIGEHLKEEN